MARIRPLNSPGQLKMFMSAGEIKREYQPLDADRESVYDPREGEATDRPFTTAGNANRRITSADRRAPFMQHQGQGRASGSGVLSHYRDYGQPETDDQLWDRKLNESQMSYGEYAEVHGGGMGTQSTPGYNTLSERGSAPQPPGDSGWSSSGDMRTSAWDQHDYDQAQYVQRKQDEYRDTKDWGSLYGTLHQAMQPGGEGFTGQVHLSTQFGQSGKPQVVGAHHRIAAMDEIDSNRLMPVVHHRDIGEARQGFAGHEYT